MTTLKIILLTFLAAFVTVVVLGELYMWAVSR